MNKINSVGCGVILNNRLLIVLIEKRKENNDIIWTKFYKRMVVITALK